MSIPIIPQQNTDQEVQEPKSISNLWGLIPSGKMNYSNPTPPAPVAAPLKRGVDVLDPSPTMQSAIQSAYKQNPTMPKGMLEAIAMQESSMGTNRANYNPSIGKSAWMFGMTPIAQQELARRGIKTDLNSPGGAARAAAAYLSLSNGKYPDHATWYKQGYNGSSTTPFNAGRFSNMVGYYGSQGGQAPSTPRSFQDLSGTQ